jgi:Tfp pilus assembly protein PilW
MGKFFTNRWSPFKRNQSGLSVIELLLAVVLLILVLIVGYNLLSLNYRAYQTGEALSAVQFDTRMAADYIFFELRNVSEISLTNDDLTHQLDIDYLSAQYPKVSSVSFSIDQAGSNYIVSYSLTGHDPGLNNDYLMESEVLLNNITSVVTGSGSTIYYTK